MCSCHLEIIITLKLYDLSSAISKFDVHILTSKTSEISNVNNTMDAMEQKQATTERGRIDELVPRTFLISIRNRSSDLI